MTFNLTWVDEGSYSKNTNGVDAEVVAEAPDVVDEELWGLGLSTPWSRLILKVTDKTEDRLLECSLERLGTGCMSSVAEFCGINWVNSETIEIRSSIFKNFMVSDTISGMPTYSCC